MEGHLGWFQVLAPMNEVAINIHMQTFCGHMFATPLGEYQGAYLPKGFENILRTHSSLIPSMLPRRLFLLATLFGFLYHCIDEDTEAPHTVSRSFNCSGGVWTWTQFCLLRSLCWYYYIILLPSISGWTGSCAKPRTPDWKYFLHIKTQWKWYKQARRSDSKAKLSCKFTKELKKRNQMNVLFLRINE